MQIFYMLRSHPSRKKLEEIHNKTSIMHMGSLSEMRSVADMRLVEPRSYAEDASSMPYKECWWYLFENSNARRIGIGDIDYKLKEEVWMRPSIEPKPDTIAAYLGEDTGVYKGVKHRIIMHVGRVLEVKFDAITVRSKFGAGDVFEHPIECVPLFYGRYAKFVDIPGFFDEY
ncbi:MAG: hypothetical protein HY513_05345 [Candidatus Aenigmarchaeota archaeon]|nr:hypothetical protein [Candidatus Aenigmarchaeota archaeon]